jgi:SOS-response transcriptional repressor LexA
MRRIKSMDTIGKRLRYARQGAGLSQEQIGALFEPPISKAAVSQWEQDASTPDASRLVVLAKSLRCSVDWLLTGTGRPSREAPNGRNGSSVALHPGAAGAVRMSTWQRIGGPGPATSTGPQADAPTVEVSRMVSEQSFALEVVGDAMRPRFPAGCIIVVEPDRAPMPEDFVVARAPDWEQAAFGQLVIVGGQRMLKQLDERYPIVPLPDNVEIAGVVVEKIMRERF